MCHKDTKNKGGNIMEKRIRRANQLVKDASQTFKKCMTVNIFGAAIARVKVLQQREFPCY